MRVGLVCISLLFVCFGAFGQKSKKLKRQEKQLKSKIANTKNLIKQTKNSKKSTVTELSIINHQIAYRESLMGNIKMQILELDDEIANNKKEIEQLEHKLKSLKEEYAKILVYAFKNRVEDYKLLYIFSSKSITEAYHRLKFVQQYAEFRQNQINKINATKQALNSKNEAIELKKQSKTSLIEVQTTQKQSFLKDKMTQQSILSNLKQNENQLKTQLKKQEQKKRQIAAAIQKAIKDEIRSSTKKTKSKNYKSTPETTALSKTFAANKGKLPWPVFKGEITSKYGKQQHDVVSTAYVENNGIDITTTKGSAIRAVFGGKVSNIFIIPGAGKVVMVSHGNYRTVYANLEEVYVKKGETISLKQKIGKLLPSDKGNVSEAHFEIWHISSSGMKSQNPSYWIYRK